MVTILVHYRVCVVVLGCVPPRWNLHFVEYSVAVAQGLTLVATLHPLVVAGCCSPAQSLRSCRPCQLFCPRISYYFHPRHLFGPLSYCFLLLHDGFCHLNSYPLHPHYLFYLLLSCALPSHHRPSPSSLLPPFCYLTVSLCPALCPLCHSLLLRVPWYCAPHPRPLIKVQGR